MRSRRNLPVLIAYIAVSLGVLGGIVVRLGVTPPWSHPYTLTANFSDADGILVNNEVSMNGVVVGRVTDVTVKGGTAWVTMTIDDSAALPLHTDATAQVRKKNLLGETYIDLQRGTASCGSCTIQSGGTIALDHTVPITEIDQVLAIFDPETVQRVQLLINAIGDGVNGQGQALNSSAQSTSQLVTALNDPAIQLSVHRQQVDDIIVELQRLYDMLATERGQVADALTTWNQVMSQLAAQDVQLGDTIAQADTLVTHLDTLLTADGGNIRTTIGELPTTLQSANAFLNQTNGILTTLAPYRESVHDIFPHLASSFADTDAVGQHFWSVYSVSCTTACGSTSAQSAPTTGGDSDSAFWAAEATP